MVQIDYDFPSFDFQIKGHCSARINDTHIVLTGGNIVNVMSSGFTSGSQSSTYILQIEPFKITRIGDMVLVLHII